MEEIWKPVKGYEGLYEISNQGRLKSLPHEVCRRGYGTIFVKGSNGADILIMEHEAEEIQTFDMQIAIAKEYIGLTDRDHEEALEWCKACIQKRIDQDHLEGQVDWEYLIVKDEKIDEHGWYRMECRLPLKELF